MEYPTTAHTLRARYPELDTTLSTPVGASTYPASMWTYDHCADILAIRVPTDLGGPKDLDCYLPDISHKFQENDDLEQEILSYPLSEDMCDTTVKIFQVTPKLYIPYYALGLVIQSPPRLTDEDQREPSSRLRTQPTQEGFVQDMESEFPSSDPISSEQEIPDDTYTVRQDESGKQEATVQFYALAWLMGVDGIYNAGTGQALSRRPQYTSIPRRIVFAIPGAQLKCESRDDCGALWRGPDSNTQNKRMTTYYLPAVVSIEAKSRKKDAFAQWVAELVGQFTEAAGYTRMDCNNPDSIAQLTNAQRTKLVLSIQDVWWQWVWTTFSVEWILAFLGSNSSFAKRPRIGNVAPEPEPTLPGLIQEDDSQDQSSEEDAMSGVELYDSPVPYLEVFCSREYLFTEPKQRYAILVSSQAAIRWGIDNEVQKGQAFIAQSP